MTEAPPFREIVSATSVRVAGETYPRLAQVDGVPAPPDLDFTDEAIASVEPLLWAGIALVIPPLVLKLVGTPGTGKSMLLRRVASVRGQSYQRLQASSALSQTPESLMGTFVPRRGEQGWEFRRSLFVQGLERGSLCVIEDAGAAALVLWRIASALERPVRELSLHELGDVPIQIHRDTAIALTANPPSHRDGLRALPLALQDRCTNIRVPGPSLGDLARFVRVANSGRAERILVNGQEFLTGPVEQAPLFTMPRIPEAVVQGLARFAYGLGQAVGDVSGATSPRRLLRALLDVTAAVSVQEPKIERALCRAVRIVALAQLSGTAREAADKLAELCGLDGRASAASSSRVVIIDGIPDRARTSVLRIVRKAMRNCSLSTARLLLSRLPTTISPPGATADQLRDLVAELVAVQAAARVA